MDDFIDRMIDLAARKSRQRRRQRAKATGPRKQVVPYDVQWNAPVDFSALYRAMTGKKKTGRPPAGAADGHYHVYRIDLPGQSRPWMIGSAADRDRNGAWYRLRQHWSKLTPAQRRAARVRIGRVVDRRGRPLDATPMPHQQAKNYTHVLEALLIARENPTFNPNNRPFDEADAWLDEPTFDARFDLAPSAIPLSRLRGGGACRHCGSPA